MNQFLGRPFTTLFAAIGLYCLVATASAADYALNTVAQQMEEPWSLAQMPDGTFLVTLRGAHTAGIAAEKYATALRRQDVVPARWHAAADHR